VRFRRWIIVYGGFTQNLATQGAAGDLWVELYYKHAGPDCAVLYFPWHYSTAALANLVEAHCRPSDRVEVFGYSYGGQTAIELTWRLHRRGIPVYALELGDPVYRSKWFVMRWRSLIPTRWPSRKPIGRLGAIRLAAEQITYLSGRIIKTLIPELEIPTDVHRCQVHYQSTSIPMGHFVRYADGNRAINRIEENRLHEQMDSPASGWYRACLSAASKE